MTQTIGQRVAAQSGSDVVGSDAAAIGVAVIDFELQSPKRPPSQDDSHEYEAVLEMIGFGWTQYIILVTTGLLFMQVLNEVMGVGILTIAAQCDFQMSAVDKSLMSISMHVGILCSSYFWGYFSDTLGRRPVLIFSTLMCNLFLLMTILVSNYWVFIALRFLAGVFISALSSATYAYLGEFVMSRLRAATINYASLSVGLSMVYVPAVAWFVLSMDWSLHISSAFVLRPWRLLIFFNLLPGLLGALLLWLVLPESPKFLLSMQRQEEALAVVNWICKLNTGRTLAALEVFKLKIEEPQSAPALDALNCSEKPSNMITKMWHETRPLFQKPHATNFLISCVVMAGMFYSSTGLGLWFPEIQNRFGFSDEEQYFTVCQVIEESLAHQQRIQAVNQTQSCVDLVTTKSLVDSMGIGFSYVLGYIFLGLSIQRVGRKFVLSCILCASFVFGIALQWLVHPFAIVVSFCLFLMLPGVGISVISSAVVDLVPTHLRGKAVCLCFMVGRAVTVIGNNIIGRWLESNCTLTFSSTAVLMLACGAITLLLPI